MNVSIKNLFYVICLSYLILIFLFVSLHILDLLRSYFMFCFLLIFYLFFFVFLLHILDVLRTYLKGDVIVHIFMYTFQRPSGTY